MFNRWKDLRFNLPLFVLLASLIPLLLFGLYSIRSTTDKHLMVQERASLRTAVQSANAVELKLNMLRQRLSATAENLDLTNLSPADLEWALLDMQRQSPMLQTLTLLDQRGEEQIKISLTEMFAVTDLRSHREAPDYLEVLDGSPYLGTARDNDHGEIITTLSLPLINPATQAVSAVLVVEILLDHFTKEILTLQIGERGSAYLVNSAGLIIAHKDQTLVKLGKTLSEAVLSKNVSQYINAEEVEVMGVAHPVALTDWLIVVELPMSEIKAIPKDQKETLYQLLIALILLVLIPFFYFIFRRVNRPLNLLEKGANQIAAGHLTEPIPAQSDDELGRLTNAFNTMMTSLGQMQQKQSQADWLKDGLLSIGSVLQGVIRLDEVANKAVNAVASYTGAQVGALYTVNKEGLFVLTGSYAYAVNAESAATFAPGQGLVGQAASNRIMFEVEDLPDEYCLVSSGLGSCQPASILLIPLVLADEVVGVIELGRLTSFTEKEKMFFEQVAEPIAIAINSSNNRLKLKLALEHAQQMAEEMQTQQEELRAANEELEDQAQELKSSEELLKAQEEELRAANEELQENAQMLEEQQNVLEERNNTLQIAQLDLKEKTRNLEISSRYKSEFLANMSHELRTPLNSLLILSRELMNNKDGNLKEDQVESAQVIYQSGNDLLTLINDILDLSKIEAGKMEVNPEDIDFTSIKSRLEKNFQHVAEDRGLEFTVDIEEGLPDKIRTDQQRLEQLLKNLLSNALKFTSSGTVQVRIFRADDHQGLSGSGLDPSGLCGFAVSDTGVGIPEQSLAEIFEAFRQVDGTISRRYGGTGLGLSISRQIAHLLGGELQAVSEVGKGSTFTFILPLEYSEEQEPPAVSETAPAQPAKTEVAVDAAAKLSTAPAAISDDRADLQKSDRLILIVEDDVAFARILAKITREKGFKYLHATDGTDGLGLAEKHKPDAIFLDVQLPGTSGFAMLSQLKLNQELRHIPVHLMSVEENASEALRLGAIGFLDKPMTQEALDLAFEKLNKFSMGQLRRLLIVEDNVKQQQAIIKLIGNGDVESIVAESGKQALKILQEQSVDCMILDLNLQDMTGFELLRQIEKKKKLKVPPTIVYTGKELIQEEVDTLRHYTSSIIIKGVQSPERLLDEVSLFLHRVVADLPAGKQEMITSLYDSDEIFMDRKVLLVDDDMRNVFALTKVLQGRGIKVFKAANGQKALDLLENEPDMEMVLMDIMMPVMDGYEAMRRIRQQPHFARLPILALTAKAMSEDQGRCIEAGANDYLSKPVDIEHLLSLMRIWLQH